MALVERSLGAFEKLRASMLMSYRSPLPPKTSWYNLKNNLCVVWLLERGYVDIRTREGLQRIEAGNWVFQMPGLVLDQVFSEEVSIMSLRFSVLWESGRSLFQSDDYKTVSDGQYPALKKAAIDFVSLLPPLLHPAPTFKYIQSTFVTNPSQAWEINAAQHLFLSKWYEAAVDLGFKPLGENSGDMRVDHVVEILGRELSRMNVPYAEIQEQVGLSRAQIDRLFTKHLKSSPKAEFDAMRVHYAAEQLWKDQRPIKQIAYDLGFNSASQFAKWFRRLDGRNPKQMRDIGLDAV